MDTRENTKDESFISGEAMKRRFYHYQRWLVAGLLIGLDSMLLGVAFLFAVALRSMLTPLIGFGIRWEEVIPIFRIMLILMVTLFWLMGLYPGYGLNGVKELERVSKALILLLLMVSSIFYLNKTFQRFPRSVPVLTLGVAWLMLPVGRTAFRHLVSHFGWYGIPVVVFGPKDWALKVGESLALAPHLGWKAVSQGSLEDLKKGSMPENEQIQVAILALPRTSNPAPYTRVLAQRFQRVIVLQKFTYFGSMWVEVREVLGYLGLEFQYHLLHPWSLALKRIIDVIGSASLILLLSPFLAAIAAWVKLDSPGPVLFRQKRLGKDFQEFEVLKFRTMVVNAEQRLQEILSKDLTAWEQYKKFHKLENDPRITRSGRWLRKFSLDELPQLWNVLRGDMSLVGPRAYMPSELEDMGEYANIILRVRPGMTGWWQVQGRHRATFQQRLQMDEYYISNWSLWVDVFVLLKTIWVVLKGEGG